MYSKDETVHTSTPTCIFYWVQSANLPIFTNPLTYPRIIGYIYLVAGRRPPEPVGHRTGDDDDV